MTARGRILGRLVALALGLLLSELLLRLAGSVYLSALGRGGPAGEVPGLTIACLGDSHTFGLFEPAAEAWPAQLQALLDERATDGPHRVVNLGIPGQNSAQVRASLDGVLADYDPDLVLVCVGTNNAWSWRADGGAEGPAAAGWEGLRLVKLLRLARARVGPGPTGPSGAGTRGGFEAFEAFEAGTEEGERWARGTDREGRAFRLPATEGEADASRLERTIAEDLAAVDAALRARGVAWLPVLYGNEGASLGLANAATRRAAEELGVRPVETAGLVEALALERGRSHVLHPDGHLRGAAYELVARAILERLIEEGRVAAAPFADLQGGLRHGEREAAPIRLVGTLEGAVGTGDELAIELWGEEAGRPVALLLSGTGDGPPATFDGHELPLVDDGVFRTCVARAELLRRVDADGRARFPLGFLFDPSRAANLRGTELRAMYVVYVDDALAFVRWTSDAADFTLE